MEDAGMTPKDINGVGMISGIPGPAPAGLDSVSATEIAHMLDMPTLTCWGSSIGMLFAGATQLAVAGIKAGYCHTCIIFRVVKQAMSGGELLTQETSFLPQAVRGDAQFTQPFGVLHGVQSIGALPTQRHMALYGTKEEHFGAHVVAQRYHASLNENALFRTPLTIQDYLNARYVSKPVRILDCDYPCDSGGAVIFTTEERARDFKKRPIFVDAAASASIGGSFEILEDMTQSSPFHCAKELWRATDLKPKDVDCAQLYDGFTIITFQWLEALGFCKPGESGPFVAAGNTRLGAKLPVNTDGGACNVGRRHGANFCIESIRQLRGECGERQVKDAKVAVWSNAVGPTAGAVLMTKD
jgi:acetyl-CoA acetyltransferase